MNLIILTRADQTGENEYLVADHRADHILTVLQKRPGDRLRVGLVNHGEADAEIVACTDGAVKLQTLELTPDRANTPEVTLVCAIPRPKTLRKVLALTANLGIAEVHFVRACRVDKSYLQSQLLEPEGYMPLLLEGLSQGRLTRLPVIHVHRLFRPFAEDQLPELLGRAPGLVGLIPHPEALGLLTSVLVDRPARVMLAIGPEGGWVDFELAMFEKLGFRRFSLGPWILRVETALPAAIAQLSLMPVGCPEVSKSD